MAMPDFICIGAQKAGTTWLHDMLSQHPALWVPPLKEVHYFDFLDASPEKVSRRGMHIARLANKLQRGRHVKGSGDDNAAKAAFLRTLLGEHVLTPEWYSSIFEHADAQGRVTGEITPAYLELGADKLKVVAEMLPKTKFVLIVRDPFGRAISQMKMAISRTRSTPKEKSDWDYFIERNKRNERGNYQSAIPLWHDHIGTERLLILPFGLVRHDPAQLLRKVEDHIGAAPFEGYEAMTEASHKTKAVDIPDWVIAEVERGVGPQRDYLIEAFGEEFYKQTR